MGCAIALRKKNEKVPGLQPSGSKVPCFQDSGLHQNQQVKAPFSLEPNIQIQGEVRLFFWILTFILLTSSIKNKVIVDQMMRSNYGLFSKSMI